MPTELKYQGRVFFLHAEPFKTQEDHLDYVDAICNELHSELVDLGFAYEGGPEEALAEAVHQYNDYRKKQR